MFSKLSNHLTMIKRLQIIVFTLLSFNLMGQTSVTFSVQAHQDDWQLFMSSRIVADLTAGAKVVFITLTAGDGSSGTAAYSPTNVPFYIARENGAVYSSKYVADLTSGATPAAIPTGSTVVVNTHIILKYVYGNTVNYFLRLPDGNGDGSGFVNTGYKSLEKLKTGAALGHGVITSIAAIDGSATYTSWLDLTNTIKQIILNEKITGLPVMIDAAHTITGVNSVYNPLDHSDHRYASLAVQEAVSSFAWAGVNGFMDYESSANAANLSATDNENAAVLFNLCTFGLSENQYQSDFVPAHKAWLPMDYFQVLKIPVGNAPFANPLPGGGQESDLRTAENSTDHGLIQIPMIVTITSPVFINKDISAFISPYQTGQLVTTIYDQSGNKITELNTKVTNKEGLLITLNKAIKIKGEYIIKTVLNDQFIESRKIVVE